MTACELKFLLGFTESFSGYFGTTVNLAGGSAVFAAYFVPGIFLRMLNNN